MRHLLDDPDSKKQTTRQPIPLSPDEEKSLRQYAQTEARSKQSMAGIIYRMGLEAYESRTRSNKRDK
ncbi:hypothetical protein GCM10007386_48850 [Pseudoduganella dura]|nr:hypothetical protein GCM10007386_48850 [Pseudoduganella dura]